MEYRAIDLHKKECQIRIVADDGQVLVDRRITTARDRLTAVFGSRPPLRILIEASTESECVAQHLERLSHEVVVADPNYTPMYGPRTRRIKTDRRDVAALAEACRLGIYHPAHRRSAQQRIVQDDLNVRSELVQARVRAMALARAITRAAGYRLRSGASESFLTRLAALDLPAAMADTLAPLQQVIDVLDHELARADARFATRVATDPVVQRLMTVPGIGPITASAFVAALDDVHRFGGPRGAARVASYLGLVPREHSSGEQQRRGRVLRSAHPYVQGLLVEAAWRTWRSADPRTAALRFWARRLASRRGTKIALVALARRLARILFAIWRDDRVYQATSRHEGGAPTRPLTDTRDHAIV
jgi:transposase